MKDARQLEAEAKAACECGDHARAATLVLQRYGDEILGFLITRLRSEGDGREVFAMFAEDLWVGLPKFAWRSSMRTWAYTLARNAAYRFVKAPHQQRARNLTFSGQADLSRLVEHVRSETKAYKRTEAKDRLRALRERLEADDQMLLVLRVDRRMPWRELALVLLGDSEGATDSDALERECTRLRKRFERVKNELKRMAQDEGLV